MKRSTNGILTTHMGSLPRPPELLELLLAKERGKTVAPQVFEATVKRAVADAVKRQADAGITVLNDGEMSKPSYATYVKDRLTGFEGDENTRLGAGIDARDFPEWAARGGLPSSFRRPCCNGPVQWKDFAAVQTDIDNIKASTRSVKAEDIFMTAPSPATISLFHPNQYYPSRQAYLYAVADAMKQEYKAIVDAGLVLQIDCPDLGGRREPEMSLADVRKDRALNIEVLNYATRDLPPEQMRMHVCWGAGEGPHHRDVELKDTLDILLTARPLGMTIVGANGRHAHEWSVWKGVKVPDGKVIIPGVIDSTTNIIEHPETVAERIVRYASVLGRGNVIAGVDCGFATIGVREQLQVDPKVTWAKLRALADGALLATKELWRT